MTQIGNLCKGTCQLTGCHHAYVLSLTHRTRLLSRRCGNRLRERERMAAPPRAGFASAAGAAGGLTSLLCTDFLVSPSNNKVNPEDLEGKTVGLYFAANWYLKCEAFTPILAGVYRQLRDQGARFEVVFVSSDESHASFERFHGTMPWPAVPFEDLRAKRSLTEAFQIEGIPSLIVLGPDGTVLAADGVELVRRHRLRAFPFTPERMAEFAAEEKKERASQTLEKLLSVTGKDYVIKHDGQLQVPVSGLVGKTIALFFSARWCSPCVKFTSKLAFVYGKLRERSEDFEVVFVSMDRDEAGFSEHHSAMPWPALPYGNESSRALARYLGVQDIPALVVIGPDGKTVTKEGRNLVNLHLEMAFPFTADQIRLLREKMDEEAKRYPSTVDHVGHGHVLNLVSEDTGGGSYICCECDEQGLGWAYQCPACGYEIHLKCCRGAQDGEAGRRGHSNASCCVLSGAII